VKERFRIVGRGRGGRKKRRDTGSFSAGGTRKGICLITLFPYQPIAMAQKEQLIIHRTEEERSKGKRGNSLQKERRRKKEERGKSQITRKNEWHRLRAPHSPMQRDLSVSVIDLDCRGKKERYQKKKGRGGGGKEKRLRHTHPPA